MDGRMDVLKNNKVKNTRVVVGREESENVFVLYIILFISSNILLLHRNRHLEVAGK